MNLNEGLNCSVTSSDKTKKSIKNKAILGIVLFCALNIIPIKSANAETRTISAGGSAYTASLSNDNSVTFDITPTSAQKTYTKTNDLKFSTNCAKGATVSLSMNGNDNSLTQSGSSSKISPTSSGSDLSDNSWGFKIRSGNTYKPLPNKSNPEVLFMSNAAGNATIDVIYGVRVDNKIPSGTYSGEVVYTLAVNSNCLNYALTYNANGGNLPSGTSATTSVAYGSNVSLPTPTRAGYTFTGWSNGSSNFSGSVNPNPSNAYAVTLTAQWKQNIAGIHTIKNMQDMTTAICNASTTPVASATALDTNGSHHGDANYVPSTTLTDTRNNATYTVRKLADGNCWMTTDLALNMAHGTNIVTQNGTNFNPENNTLDCGSGSEADAWKLDKSCGQTWTQAGTEGARSAIYTDASAHKYGRHYYYNWYAATAGTGTASMATGDASNSICPTGWRLPSGGTGDKSFYNLLFTKYGLLSNAASSTKMQASPFDFAFIGYYSWDDGGIHFVGMYGAWWSSTVTDAAYARYLYFFASDVYPQDGDYKGHGFTVRCVSQ